MTIMMMRVIARPHQGEGAHAARVPHKDPADGQPAAVVGAVGVDGRRVVGPRVARAGQVVLDPCAESSPPSNSRRREIPVPTDKRAPAAGGDENGGAGKEGGGLDKEREGARAREGGREGGWRGGWAGGRGNDVGMY